MIVLLVISILILAYCYFETWNVMTQVIKGEDCAEDLTMLRYFCVIAVAISLPEIRWIIMVPSAVLMTWIWTLKLRNIHDDGLIDQIGES